MQAAPFAKYGDGVAAFKELVAMKGVDQQLPGEASSHDDDSNSAPSHSE